MRHLFLVALLVRSRLDWLGILLLPLDSWFQLVGNYRASPPRFLIHVLGQISGWRFLVDTGAAYEFIHYLIAAISKG